MYFKIDDKVKVLDDNQKGIIVRMTNTLITIENEFGFEDTYRHNELILDTSLEIGEVEINKKVIDSVKNTQSRRKKEESVKEIDLHFDSLVDYPSRYTPYEMLKIQLEKVSYEIDLAKNEKRNKIILIHGHGKGKLKQEIIKLLKSDSKIEMYDASFQRFNGGATVVKF